MDFEPISDEQLIKYARSFGAEARANNQKRMNRDDKDSLLAYSTYPTWGDIPKELRDKLRESFCAGWQAENSNYD